MSTEQQTVLRPFLEPYAAKLFTTPSIYSNKNAFEFLLEYSDDGTNWVALSQCHSRAAAEYMADGWSAWYLNYPAWDHVCANPHAISMLENHWPWLVKHGKIHWLKIFANPRAINFIDTHWDWLVENQKLTSHGIDVLLTNPNVVDLAESRPYWFIENKVFTGATLSTYPALYPILHKHWHVLQDHLNWDQICRNPDNVEFLKEDWSWLVKNKKVVWESLAQNPAAESLVSPQRLVELVANNALSLTTLCTIETGTAIKYIESHWDVVFSRLNYSPCRDALCANSCAVDLIAEHWDELVTKEYVNYALLAANPAALPLIEEKWDWLVGENLVNWTELAKNPEIFMDPDDLESTSEPDLYADVECGCSLCYLMPKIFSAIFFVVKFVCVFAFWYFALTLLFIVMANVTPFVVDGCVFDPGLTDANKTMRSIYFG